jgi:hypothetical protein
VKILWQFAGADPEVLALEDCKGDRSLYSILGLIVFVTSAFASLSCGYAIYTVFKDPVIAICLGLFWGFTIATIDRFLIATTVKTNSFSIEQSISAAVRIFMAITLGIIIAAPLETAILGKEIRAKIAEQNVVAEVQMKQTVSQLPESVEIARLRQENQELRDTDTKLNAAYQQAYESVIGEGEGTTGTGKAGKGIVYADKLAEMERQKAILAKTTKEHDNQVAANNAKVEELEQNLKTTTDFVRSSRLDADSLLAQITTLHKMADENPTVAWTSKLISLAFILVDVLPIVSKMLMPMTDYDRVKRRKREEVEMRQDALIRSGRDRIDEEIRRESAAEVEISGFLEQTLTESLKAAHNDPEMQKVVNSTAQKFIRQVDAKLTDEIERIHIPDSRFRDEAQSAIEQQLGNMAKPRAKRKVARRRIQTQVADYTRELRQAFQKFKNKY